MAMIRSATPVSAAAPASVPATPPVDPLATEDGYTLERAFRILRDGPRHEDRLPITAEARRRIDLHERYFTERLGGVPPAASYMHGIRVNEILTALLPGQHVVYLADEQGVTVLAVGLDGMERLLKTAPPDLGPDMTVTYVDPPGTFFA